MPRAATCRYSGRPAAAPASARAKIARHCSRAGSRCSQVDRQRPAARRAAMLLEQIELGVEALRAAHQVEVAHRLHHAVPQAVEARRRCRSSSPRWPPSAGRLRARRRCGGCRCAPVVKPAAPASSASRSERAHRGDVVVGGGLAARPRARPSRTRAAGRAAPARRSRSRAASRRARPCTRRSVSQPQRMPSASAAPGMSSTPSISSIRPSSRPGPHRREADAAVAHHDAW